MVEKRELNYERIGFTTIGYALTFGFVHPFAAPLGAAVGLASVLYDEVRNEGRTNLFTPGIVPAVGAIVGDIVDGNAPYLPENSLTYAGAVIAYLIAVGDLVRKNRSPRTNASISSSE